MPTLPQLIKKQASESDDRTIGRFPCTNEVPLDLEIRFLTDKEENILQNSIDTEKEYDDLYVKLSDETDRTKAARVKLDEYELNFKFDIKTCEVFDVEKVTD